MDEPIRVLLIDDNPDDRDLVGRALVRAFPAVRADAITDAAALDRAIEAGGFDCVITDYEIRWSNGLEVVRRVKARFPDCPVVMLTGSGNESVAVEAMKAGLDDYLTKSPTNFARAPFAVRAALDRAARRRELAAAVAAREAGAAVLQASESKLRAIFELSSGGILLVDPAGRVADANPAACRMLGLPPGEVVGRAAASFVPAGHEAAWGRVAAAVRDTGHWRGEFPLRRAGGHGAASGGSEPVVHLAWNVSTLPDGTWLAVVTDVTDRRLAEQEREQLLERERHARATAERASRMKDEFLATLSHELRTPLNAILGWADLLAVGRLSPGEAQEAGQVIARNARAQARLVEDLLDMSRIISGRVRFDAEPVDPAAAVGAAMETVRTAAAAKHIRLDAALDPAAGPVVGDAGRLQQVVWNLLANAVKFTPAGGRVDVRVDRVGEEVRITVSDDGIGIAAEFLPYVFDRFRQADATSTRRHGGLGLGLAIAKHLVELHGGTLAATSPGEGRGATFVVRLPVAAQHAGGGANGDGGAPGTARGSPPAAAVDRATGGERSPDVSLAGVRVLVVDDEPDAVRLVGRLLTSAGATVATAGSAAEALGLLAARAAPPDVLVADIGMPVRDGYDLIRAVRAGEAAATPRRPALPAVALTAFARSEDRARALTAGFQSHLAKPVEPTELLATVASLAGRAGRPV